MADEVKRLKAWKKVLGRIQPKDTRELIKEFPGMEEIIKCFEEKRIPSFPELIKFEQIVDGLI